jgi:type VI secretion system protein ImpB
MPNPTSAQRFIGRNRPPRVQIQYELETNGSPQKINLPFVMGVMADLSGKPADPLAPLEKRDFLEINVDNFDDRLKKMKPRVAFQVPNTLGDPGTNLSVDITFESMDDFSPGAVARKVEPTRKLLEAREQLKTLLSLMDGKSDASGLIERILADPATQKMLASAPPPTATAPATDE